MVEVTVRGATRLARVAGAVQRVAPELRKELLREIRTGVRPVIKDIRAEALDSLPSRGGLGEMIAGSRYAVRTRTSGKQVGVRVEGRLTEIDLDVIDRGRVRHPVFAREGRSPSWVNQPVRPGFFSRPVAESFPQIQKSVMQAMDNVAEKIRRAGS